MSVTTTADEQRQKAKESISDAIKSLNIVLDTDTWGHENYTTEAMDDFEDIITILLKAKRML